MPNWIEGSLKLRGPYENVKKFFQTGLNIYSHKWNEKDEKDECTPIPREQWCKTYEDDGYFEFTILDDQWVYVENTRRAFITGEHEIYFYKPSKSDKEDCIVAMVVHQAWAFDEDDWVEIAKKYNVDVRLYGLECGMTYGTEIEIKRDGTVLKNYDFTYMDWNWDCPFPWKGG